MKYEAHDQIRLVALIGAFVLFLLGALMMWRGVAVEGTIDLKSSLISGSIKTGSAGLFIIFLSFIVIVFVLAGSPSKLFPKIARQFEERSRFKQLLPIFYSLLSALIISVVLACYVHAGFGLLAISVGMLLLVVVIYMLSFLEVEQ